MTIPNDSNKAANDRAATKYDAAVAKARGEEPKHADATSGELTIGEVPAGALVPAAEARAILSERVKSGAWEQAPQLATIPKGQTLLDWKLEGNGPEAEFVDDKTGVVNFVKTWILSKGGVRISILSSVQLDKKLPPFVGGLVSITRGEDIRNGSSLYTDYLVCGPARSDGTPRDWAKPASSPPGVPEVKPEAKA